eukprot:TRINITY_DN2168_c0_g1_i1.p1 TRINITY_DN2168_c0_g1~~TRINITY_DN2168_c0_g1_i1.p1  ORF type:complete len:247 (-),score=38.25 TRINITY_DN2168_c0_g1_i1:838-1578(-)
MTEFQLDSEARDPVFFGSATSPTMSIQPATSQPDSSPVRLNAAVPNFDAVTTFGTVNFFDYKKGSWAILFSHPADFTPVCTTEFLEFGRRFANFEALNVKLLGCSVDSIYAHVAWMRNIEEKFGVKIPFPTIADLDQKVSRLYGMVQEVTYNTTAVRCVFFIDPNNILRASIYYPLNVGRNFDEIERVIKGLQFADKHKVACPANWQPGDKVIVPPPLTMNDAEARVKTQGLDIVDWYFSKKQVTE